MLIKPRKVLNNIKNSLNVKIFLVTFGMLMLVGGMICGIVMVAMPNTYQTKVDENLESRLNQLKKQLKQVKVDQAGETINQFMANNYVDIILTDSSGNIVKVPEMWTVVTVTLDDQESEDYVINTGYSMIMEGEESKVTITKDGEEKTQTDDKEAERDAANEGDTGKADDKINIGQSKTVKAMVQMSDYTIQKAVQFQDSSDTYYIELLNSNLIVRQASEILLQILPMILGILFIFSLLIAFIYARFITRPIKIVSQTAQRMATLDLTCGKPVKRKDEIGILSNSLNEMAAELLKTLKNLETANSCLEADIRKEREMEQKRRAFFAAVSHELKTPITIIKGQLEGMLYKVGAYKDRDTYLDRSLAVTNQMEEMVQEILSISRIESTNFALQKEHTSLSKLVRSCTKEMEELAESKQIKIEEQFSEAIDAIDQVSIDVKLMKKVISNLISNGITHSPDGERIILQLAPSNEGIRLAIENTGVHIAEGERGKVFEAFYRVEKSRNRHTGGTGLGLYIVKLILDMHQLEYELVNTPLGIQFTINFTQNTN